MNNRVFTTGEVAKYCRVNLRTVIRWVERGDLPAYQLPGRGDKRIEFPDFMAFLKKHNLPIPSDLTLQSPTVLIVDDDPAYAKSIERVLKKQGFQTAMVQNGFEAGVYLASEHPALMILDLNMPGMNGFEVLEFVRKHPQLKALQILVISALDALALQQAKTLGATDTLEKPFENNVLIEKVHTLIERQAPSLLPSV